MPSSPVGRRATPLLAFLLLPFAGQVAGYCSDSGLVYEDNSSWRLGPCLTCSCNASVVLCEEQQCPALVCDADGKDEALTFLPDRCCPVCRRRFRGCLSQDGTTVAHGAKWPQSASCEVCVCVDGNRRCRTLACSELDCLAAVRSAAAAASGPGSSGSAAVPQLQAECCKSCSAAQRPQCATQGRYFNVGDTWQQSACVRCMCGDGGDVQCFAKACAPLPARCRGQPFVPEGSCCPVCPDLICTHNGNSYQDGQLWRSGCSDCVCAEGHVKCDQISCQTLEHCVQGSRLLTTDDGCCQYCVPTDGACEYEGALYYHGQQWNVSRCGFCTCTNSKIICQTAQCMAVEQDREHVCLAGEHITDDEGLCCPVCKRQRTCTNSQGAGAYKEGDTWFEGTCKMCTCRGAAAAAAADCYLSSCYSDRAFASGGITSGSRVEVMADGRASIPYTSLISSRSQRPPRLNVLLLQGPTHGRLITSTGLPLAERASVEISFAGAGLTYEHSTGAGRGASGRGGSQYRQAAAPAAATDYDYMVLHVFAGRSSANHVIQVHVTVAALPKIIALEKNSMSASHGSMTPINSSMLAYAADGCEHHSLVYDITRAPELGDVVVAVPVPLSGALPGWTADDATSGEYSLMSLTTATFRQVDIDEGRIYYRRRSDVTAAVIWTSDSFEFSVGCSSSRRGSEVPMRQFERLDGQIMSIAVSAPKKAARQQHRAGASSAAVLKAAAPAALVLALENQTTLITLADLPQLAPGPASSEQQQRSGGVVYTVTRPLSTGHGALEYADSPFQPITRFTQQDVIDRRLVYRPPLKDQGPLAKDVDFTFTVSLAASDSTAAGEASRRPGSDDYGDRTDDDNDDDYRMPQAEQSLAIRLVPVNDQPPRLLGGGGSGEQAAVVELVVHGGAGSSAALDQRLLDVVDADSLPDQLSVTVKREPAHGDLVKAKAVDGDRLRIYLRLDDRFTYTEILDSSIKYVHDGSRTTEDSFSLKIDDGDHSLDVTVRVIVLVRATNTPAQPPAKAASACMTATVKEGETVTLASSTLEFTSPSSRDAVVTLTLASAPLHGTLRHASRGALLQGQSVTQREIAAGLISYAADDEVGYGDVADSIYFNVSDSSGGTLPLQVLTITVQACDNKPPYCVQHVPFKVDEAGRNQLTGAHLNCYDVDTPPNELLVVVDVEPSFGLLQTITAGNAAAAGVRRTHVKAFTQDDLDRGHLYYNQSNHSRIEPRSDAFMFHVTDGTNMSPTARFNITIEAKNDEPPTIIAEHILVEEGKAIALTTSTIYVTDIDSDATAMVLTVEAVPVFGLLLQKLNADAEAGPSQMHPGDTFLYKELQQGSIVYAHDGGEASTNDSFVVSVSDGEFSRASTVTVVVALVDDETPRLSINNGLKIKKGMTAIISRELLRAADIDSEDAELTFVITKPPRLGLVQWSAAAAVTSAAGRSSTASARERQQQPPSQSGTSEPKLGLSRFTQRHVDLGYIEYAHYGNVAGVADFFKFNVADANDNTLLEQTFYIDIATDTSFPEVLRNTWLVVREKGAAKLTTNHLLVIDVDADSDSLTFEVLEKPRLGQLQIVGQQGGAAVTEFTLADLSAGKIAYVHNSTDEVTYVDSIIFGVSDGSNSIMLSFNIEVLPVDDSLPLLMTSPLTIHEGTGRAVSEFEVKAADNDTKDELITFTIVRAPTHGKLELLSGGYSSSSNGDPASAAKVLSSGSTFSMADVYAGRLRYSHDGSEVAQDVFLLTVSDGTNDQFMLADGGEKRLMLAGTGVEVRVDVIAVDDGVPLLVRNTGIQHLQSNKGKINSLISEAELKAEDNDTAADRLVFKVTQLPLFGRLERLNTVQDGMVVSQFTQADVNNGVISYVLTAAPRRGLTADSFKFDVMDTRPNVLRGNTFHVAWSTVSFEKDIVHVREPDGIVRIPILREGNLKEYSVVSCRSRQGSATVSITQLPGDSDYDGSTVQVHFESGQSMKTCDVRIRDDNLHEGSETFYVEIDSPVNALAVTPSQIQVVIDDLEDQPVLQFAVKGIEVNETDGFVRIPITRIGDASSAVWVMCITHSLTATGSRGAHYTTGIDYESREESGSRRSAAVHLDEGVTNASCDVKIVDDAVYEELEEFEVHLVHPSYNARLGTGTTAIIRIAGPNDASIISMQTSSVSVGEDAGQAVVYVARSGVDLSMTSTVWCSTKLAASPPAAEPLQDYLPLTAKVVFEPQQTIASCTVKILDDEESPQLEGTESFVVALSAAAGGATLAEPMETRVSIDDALQDAPRVQFEHETYYVHESARAVSATIRRTGDLRPDSSIICYTRQRSAMAGEDFEERPLLNASRIRFAPGQSAQNCTVRLIDDEHFESEEEFILRLTQPLASAPYSAVLGKPEAARVIVNDADDEPTVRFDRPAYSVAEPSRRDLGDAFTSPTSNLTVRIVRFGDPRPRVTLRCSTRDGSATSGVDYRASSRMITFESGVRHVDLDLTVLENVEARWHLSFSVVLELPSGARLGNQTSTVVTILDNQETAVVVMPAAPLVISLVNYRPGAQSAYRDSPSSGHPLLCLHSCDPVHPAYTVSAVACRKDAINSSATKYQWEVALGGSGDGTVVTARPTVSIESLLFVTLSDSTPFASLGQRVLESFYFRAGFYVRCTVQPIHKSGQPGVPLRSLPVLVTAARPVCPSLASSVAAVAEAAAAAPATDDRPPAVGVPYAFAAQSFVVALRHLPATDPAHPNTVHVRVTVPHEDGMLPLVSTFPLRDVRLLMASAAYRQQHPCSNFVGDSASRVAAGARPVEQPMGARVEDVTRSARELAAVGFYAKLDAARCVWTFDAWYGVSQLIDVCGGSAASAFDGASAAGTSYLTVRLPLHVAYLFAAGAAGWTSLEQQTEAAVSFQYETSQLNSGSAGGVDGDRELPPPGGQLQVTKLSVDLDGRLVVEFRTVPKYRGLYVLLHSTLPGATSQVLPPAAVSTNFELQLLTTQPTYDSPIQTWRARSLYSLQDYSGAYDIELVPCIVKAQQRYAAPPTGGKIGCTAQEPTRFTVSISFQQAFRPVPVRYTLSAHFQLTSSPESFLADPRSAHEDDDMDVITTFSRGQSLYGRVFWDPLKDLGAAYHLTIQKVFVCTGANGYVPTYDPSGDVYGKGQQYGCLQPSRKLRHRFLVLDQADRTDGQWTKAADTIDFQAVFARDSVELSALQMSYHGADGFRMSVDPLCEVAGDYRWYVQVLYTIEPIDDRIGGGGVRRARAASAAAGQPLEAATRGTSIAAIAVLGNTMAAVGAASEFSYSGAASGSSSDSNRDSLLSQAAQSATGWPVAVTSAVAVAAAICIAVALLIVRKQLPSCPALPLRRTAAGIATGQLPPPPRRLLSPTDGVQQAAASSPSAALLPQVVDGRS